MWRVRNVCTALFVWQGFPSQSFVPHQLMGISTNLWEFPDELWERAAACLILRRCRWLKGTSQTRSRLIKFRSCKSCVKKPWKHFGINSSFLCNYSFLRNGSINKFASFEATLLVPNDFMTIFFWHNKWVIFIYMELVCIFSDLGCFTITCFCYNCLLFPHIQRP